MEFQNSDDPLETNQPPRAARTAPEFPEAEGGELPDPLARVSNQITTQLAQLQGSTERGLSELIKVVESRLSYDEAKEKAFDRLYAELDELKRDREFDHMRPLFTDLILLFDRIDHLRRQSERTESGLLILESILEELMEILGRRGVTVTPSTDYFDPALQQALGTDGTTNQEDNNRISRIVRRGFRYDGKVLRHEEVFVYRFTLDGPGSGAEGSNDGPPIKRFTDAH